MKSYSFGFEKDMYRRIHRINWNWANWLVDRSINRLLDLLFHLSVMFSSKNTKKGFLSLSNVRICNFSFPFKQKLTKKPQKFWYLCHVVKRHFLTFFLQFHRQNGKPVNLKKIVVRWINNENNIKPHSYIWLQHNTWRQNLFIQLDRTIG